MNKIQFGDCRDIMRGWVQEGIKVQTCVTSPPYYGLRDYGHDGQIGLEDTPEKYIEAMVDVFRHVKNILADDGTLWLNIGDSYAGSGGSGNQFGQLEKGLTKYKQGGKPQEFGCKPKDLIGIPWMLAFALRADGWYLRQDIIWHKPNPMPESVQDRCTKAHEYIFLMSKSQKYYYDIEAIQEQAECPKGPGNKTHRHTQEGIYVSGSQKNLAKIGASETRNKRSVWTINVKPYTGAHFAVFPSDLIEPCILAGAPVGGIVLDPFMGSGTTAQVAQKLGRKYLGCELNNSYKSLQDERIAQMSLELF